MTKNEIIYKFIDEHVFPDTNWEIYYLCRHNGAYLSRNYWCKIRDMFSITREEVIQHLNEYIRTKVDIPIYFNVILEQDGTFNYS